MSETKIVLTVIILMMVGLMVLDQIRARGMTALKWAIAPMLASVLIYTTWAK